MRHARPSTWRSQTTSAWRRQIPGIAGTEPTRRRRSSTAPTSSGTTATSTVLAAITSPRSRSAAALLLEFPDDLDILDKHASSLNNLSILFGEAGQRRSGGDARRIDRFARAAGRGHAGRRSRRERYLSNLGSCYGNLGTSHLDNGDLDEAATGLARRWRSRRSRSSDAPISVDYLERVGASHSGLGELEIRTGQSRDCAIELDKLDSTSSVFRSPAGRRGFPDAPGSLLGFLADVETESGSTTPALNLARRAVSEAEEILGINPRYHPASQGLAVQLVAMRSSPGKSAIPIVPLRILTAPRQSSASWSRPTPS